MLIIALPMGFVACGDDDETPPVEPPKPPVEEKFTWNGDWNDPADPHYATYKGKYNPIEGEWEEKTNLATGLHFQQRASTKYCICTTEGFG